jgi:methyl-accepting chemotaxis protein
MRLVVQVSIVAGTAGVLALGWWTAREVGRFLNRVASDIAQLTSAVRESATQIDLAVRETRALADSLRDCVLPVQRVIGRLEQVGERTADLTSAILEELEGPVFSAAAAAHGVRTGADHFLKSLMHRFDHHGSPS